MSELERWQAMQQLEGDALGDCDAILRAATAWLLANADYAVRNKYASPGMISDSLAKLVDQRLDMEKQAGEGSDGDDALLATLAEIRAETLQLAEQDRADT